MISRYDVQINDRLVKEIDDEVEEDLKSIKLSKGKWRMGGMFYKPFWRVILQVDTLEYDVLFPGLFKTEAEAERQAKKITYTLLQEQNKG